MPNKVRFMAEVNAVVTRQQLIEIHKSEYQGQVATRNQVAVDGVIIDGVEMEYCFADLTFGV